MRRSAMFIHSHALCSPRRRRRRRRCRRRAPSPSASPSSRVLAAAAAAACDYRLVEESKYSAFSLHGLSTAKSICMNDYFSTST